jgi:hypothetical protein
MEKSSRAAANKRKRRKSVIINRLFLSKRSFFE